MESERSKSHAGLLNPGHYYLEDKPPHILLWKLAGLCPGEPEVVGHSDSTLEGRVYKLTLSPIPDTAA